MACGCPAQGHRNERENYFEVWAPSRAPNKRAMTTLAVVSRRRTTKRELAGLRAAGAERTKQRTKLMAFRAPRRGGER